MEFNEITSTTDGDILARATIEVFGFALLASTSISGGIVNLVPKFINNTSSVISVDWVNSHIFLVKVVASNGDVFDVNQLLPPPIPQPPLDIPPGGEFEVQYTVDTSKYPYLGNLMFDPKFSPYTFVFECNSMSYPFIASCRLPVV
ncbi:hypothetical protein ACYG9R_17830 [Mesorhizobium sp. RSR565B]|uniref:hypothetical protein n=1 Tax=unclassified Mesorhizobium TaxID=325217 RepID=UPI0003CEFBF0|nr:MULTISPECIES: hypothetical protein [unclassified Mesorhizobium]ESW67183.1 hypothetical protein X771_15050 [Mesorhizobium sp. LSJC277A00]ESZ50867.1 hypothetical protein X730_05705 [Mesorhizobium sp. L103C565B0]